MIEDLANKFGYFNHAMISGHGYTCQFQVKCVYNHKKKTIKKGQRNTVKKNKWVTKYITKLIYEIAS